MKLSKVTLAMAVLVGVCASQQVMAAAGTVHFKGELVESSCNVTTDSKDQTVDLGRWPTSQFQQTGDVSTSKAFTINLENCEAGDYTIRFDGNSPAGRPDLLAVSGGASGVGIEVLDLNGSTFPVSQEISDPAIITVGDDKTATVNLKAHYKSYQDEVTAGTANADATFAIEYR